MAYHRSVEIDIVVDVGYVCSCAYLMSTLLALYNTLTLVLELLILILDVHDEC
jgi:hypothetical protein